MCVCAPPIVFPTTTAATTLGPRQLNVSPSVAAMDITSFVVQGRNQALLYGDHSTYHRQSTKRLLHSRKKLGIANKNRGKFVKRELPAAQDVAAKPEYVRACFCLRVC